MVGHPLDDFPELTRPEPLHYGNCGPLYGKTVEYLGMNERWHRAKVVVDGGGSYVFIRLEWTTLMVPRAILRLVEDSPGSVSPGDALERST